MLLRIKQEEEKNSGSDLFIESLKFLLFAEPVPNINKAINFAHVHNISNVKNNTLFILHIILS